MGNLFNIISFFEKLGISGNISILYAAIVLVFIFILTSLFKYILNKFKNSKLAKDLAPYYEYQQVKAFRRNFVPTRNQRSSPTIKNEPIFMIDYFSKIVFNEKKKSNKFYLILADSGMGKTTFLINLYEKYASFFNFSRKYKIKFYPLGDNNSLNHIRDIKQDLASHTILLLDSLDEDNELIKSNITDGFSDDERFLHRLDEILNIVQYFHRVVITCRTQFYPKKEKDQHYLNLRTYDENGYHKLERLYISPFDKKDIDKYLNKKYGIIRFWNFKKKKKASNIVKKSFNLMVRPMLLSYIDSLVDHKQFFKNNWQIYETLVNKWLKREAKKHRYKGRDRIKFKMDLYNFSRMMAVEIYNNRKITHSLSLNINIALDIAHNNNIDLCNYEITGQSLLIRDSIGNWKFAHKLHIPAYPDSETGGIRTLNRKHADTCRLI